MITDPLLKYAVQHEDVSKRLFDISMMSKTKWNSVEAQNYHAEVEQAATAGSGLAMCLCARFCRLGIGVKISGAEAMEWGKKAANQGFAPGYFEIGSCYEHGVGVEVDHKKATEYYEESASAGYGFAATQLAAKLHDGGLGDKHIEKALMYAQLGYKYGDATAPLILGGWYENGDGIEKNESAAVMWYERGSELGSFLASERLHSAYLYGELGLLINKSKAKKYLDLFELQTNLITQGE
ncbi:MAG: sel1 repeat family protein [Candidatus Thiodiazotropha sp. (ex Semelilucina semeliformis)]|nr:sel1 repeat family protein [Candidatus Thiodiazotropha sp. (ex Semelilucina semeliformis)]